jgi:hypothetical protein
LKGGSFDGSPLGEYPGCLPFGSWWLEPLGIWVGKLIITCIVVGVDVITGCWTSYLSLLVIGWTTIGN